MLRVITWLIRNQRPDFTTCVLPISHGVHMVHSFFSHWSASKWTIKKKAVPLCWQKFSQPFCWICTVYSKCLNRLLPMSRDEATIWLHNCNTDTLMLTLCLSSADAYAATTAHLRCQFSFLTSPSNGGQSHVPFILSSWRVWMESVRRELLVAVLLTRTWRSYTRLKHSP